MNEDIRLELAMKRIDIRTLEDKINHYAALARLLGHPRTMMLKLVELELELVNMTDEYHEDVKKLTK